MLHSRGLSMHPSPSPGRLSVTSLRRLLHSYGPLFALGVTILGLFTMAACIGLSLNVNL